MGVIYLRTCLVNGKQYVGQTIDFKKRESHWKSFKLKYANQLLTEDREKYGLNNWKVEILEECDDLKLDELERYYIEKFNTVYPNGYNANKGGSISFQHSEETKNKISVANSGEKNGMFGKTPWNKGKHHSEETKKKLSESHKGNKSALGHVVSDEAKKKISYKKKGVPNRKLAKPMIQLYNDGTTVEWESVADAKDSGFYGTDRVCRGERKQAYECKWFYKEDYEKMLGENS